VGQKLHDNIMELELSNVDSSSTQLPQAESYELPSKAWLKSIYDELSVQSTKPDVSESNRSAIEVQIYNIL